MHHREDRSREGADGAEELLERIVVSQRIAPAAGKFVDVLASGPDLQSRRGAEHNGTHVHGSQAVEGGDDTVGHLGTEGVAPALVVEGDDADLSEDFGPDDGPFEANGSGRGRAALGARLTIVLSHGLSFLAWTGCCRDDL
jgi:hypothetical protein